MASNVINFARKETALSSSMLPSQDPKLNEAVRNPEQLKAMQEAEARAKRDGSCIMLGREYGIYIGVPSEAKGKGR